MLSLEELACAVDEDDGNRGAKMTELRGPSTCSNVNEARIIYHLLLANKVHFAACLTQEPY